MTPSLPDCLDIEHEHKDSFHSHEKILHNAKRSNTEVPIYWSVPTWLVACARQSVGSARPIGVEGLVVVLAEPRPFLRCIHLVWIHYATMTTMHQVKRQHTCGVDKKEIQQ